MKKFITIILILISILIFSREFVFLTELEHGTVGKRRDLGPQKHDFNKNGEDELIMWSFMGGSFVGESFLYFYEYKDDYSFDLIKTNYYSSHIWMADIGDFDNDGLYEILGGIADSSYIYTMEQSDSFDLPDSITWHSDTIYNTNKFLMSTNKLKADSIDRIAGLGIPGISTTVYGKGFYYYECIGDNNYAIQTFEDSLETLNGFDIGDIDNNGKVDIFILLKIGNVVERYESTDSNADSFILIDTTMVERSGQIYIMEDTDGDGKRELLHQKNNWYDRIWRIASFGFDLYEDDNGDGSLDSIWATDFEVGTNPNVPWQDDLGSLGGSMDYGDIDGDGNNEIIICGGRHFEVWKSTGNNTYEKIFEWTNPTYTTLGSHLRCHDFNKNGIDEIIYSGSGVNVGDENTFIFECRPLSKLGINKHKVDLGNTPINDTLLNKELWLYSLDELAVIIDSMKLKNDIEFDITNPIIYPCSIPSLDSNNVYVEFSSGTIGYYCDTMLIYSNDWYGEIDTIELQAGIEVQIEIDSAVACDGRNAEIGIDYDDFVRLYFNYPIEPVDTSTIDLDAVLKLSNSHTWYDGTGNIKYISYVNNNNEMLIFLSTDTSLPTIAVGDTIYPDSVSIEDERNYSYLKKPIVITGTFDPTGIDEPQTLNSKLQTNLTINYDLSTMDLCYSIPNNDQTSLIIYDITGRKITNKTHTKQGTCKLNLSEYPKGIYFINLKTETNTTSRKIIIF